MDVISATFSAEWGRYSGDAVSVRHRGRFRDSKVVNRGQTGKLASAAAAATNDAILAAGSSDDFA